MPRMVINVDPDNKRWLDEEARKRRVPMTELVRQAVDAYRIREPSRTKPSLQNALEDMRGIWRQGDALGYQQRLRVEWNHKS